MSRTKSTEATIAARTLTLASTLDRCLSEGAKAFTGPSIHFHHRTVLRLAELGSVQDAVRDDSFANSLYATVACWGMHRMGPTGAKMVSFEIFQESLIRNGEAIQNLGSLNIQQLHESKVDDIVGDLWQLIKGDAGIRVSTTNSPLVAASKVLHHLIPSLMPPIDRTYTAEFFVWKNRMQDCPEEMFRDVFPRLVSLAKTIEVPAQRHLGAGFNTSLTKIMDNAIVGFIRLRKSNARGTRAPRRRPCSGTLPSADSSGTAAMSCDPAGDLRGQFRLFLCSPTIVVRAVRIICPRFVALLEQAERQRVCGAAPAGFGAREGPCRIARGEALVLLLDAQVAGLKQPPKVSGREVGLDPVAEADHGSAGAGAWGGDPRPERDGPLVAQRLFPDERHVSVGGARDLHLVEGCAGCQDASEDFLDFGLAAAGMEKFESALAREFAGAQLAVRNHQKCERGRLPRRAESIDVRSARRRGTVRPESPTPAA